MVVAELPRDHALEVQAPVREESSHGPWYAACMTMGARLKSWKNQNRRNPMRLRTVVKSVSWSLVVLTIAGLAPTVALAGLRMQHNETLVS